MRPHPRFSKITRAKWAGGLSLMAECLLCKYKVLSSNPVPPPAQKSTFGEIKLKCPINNPAGKQTFKRYFENTF
jgi:hypothetical protein